MSAETFAWKSPEEKPGPHEAEYICLIRRESGTVPRSRAYWHGEWQLHDGETLLGWMDESALASLPIAEPPKQRKCEKCGRELPATFIGTACYHDTGCWGRQLSAAVARAEKSESEMQELLSDAAGFVEEVSRRYMQNPKDMTGEILAMRNTIQHLLFVHKKQVQK